MPRTPRKRTTTITTRSVSRDRRNNSPIKRLPDEILLYIFSYLTLNQLIPVKRVTKKFEMLVAQSNIWSSALTTQETVGYIRFASSYFMRDARSLFRNPKNGIVVGVTTTDSPRIRSGYLMLDIPSDTDATEFLSQRGYEPVMDDMKWRLILLHQHSKMEWLCGGYLPVPWVFDQFVQGK